MNSHILYVLYYLALLLAFGYFMVFHFPNMTALTFPSLDPASINKLVNEIDDNSFHHHPSWPQRWSHPEFAADDFSRTWVHAPWFQNTKRRARRFLFPALPSKFPWGYVIYRTVYTAESDELWPIAMDKLSQIIDYAIDCQVYADIRDKEPEDPQPESTAERLVKESRRDVIFSDKFWDGAEREQVRQHFVEYLRASKGHHHGRFQGCLRNDEKLLKSIVDSHIPRPWLGGRCPDMPRGPPDFVEMIDGRYPGNKNHPDWPYPGFMRVEIRCLWFLHQELSDQHMWEVCPSVPEGLIPVFDGGTGKAQHEAGNGYPTVLDRGTRLF
ncbi:hypothetical protein KXW98_004399 [Aspergillus fumigatus]|nr:hypothetical protein KXX30_008189 [Aspergillus fumigatus]KAH1356386.1 hypothetical protein KXX63_000407 [Aspergillus fumigatus]KAH1376775.1 hypothetical protein KXX10_000842 [Aspergillus fumigatus]KAH1393414.1 hypothetical protein KXX50_007473 [Aspergillus fumigatus]KAH1407542.1 hypothetical protein KXX22_000817 [Aspergillus fumigatus]